MITLFEFPGHGQGQAPSLAEVGGKAFSLLKGSEANLPVPPGTILPVQFFEQWFAELKATETWSHFLGATTDNELRRACDDLKLKASQLNFSDEQKTALSTVLSDFAPPTLFAVRSSSPEEDLEGASFAGGYETVLGVTSDSLTDSIKHAFASCLDVRVAIYKREHGFDITNPKIALVIQQQIASDVSGVGFSLNPITNNYDEAVFNVNWGLGETVVAGTVTPDQFTVDKVTRTVTSRIIGSKETSIWLTANGGTTTKSNYRSGDCTLCDQQLLSLTELIQTVESLYQKPIDIEWAFSNDQLYLLQARPITTFIPLPPVMVTAPGEKKRVYLDVTISVQGVYQPMSAMGTSIFALLVSRFTMLLFSKDITTDVTTTVPIAIGGRLYVNLSNVIELAGKEKLSGFWSNLDPLAGKIIAAIDEREYPGDPHIKSLLHHLIWRVPEIASRIIEAEFMPEHARRHIEREIQLFLNEARVLDGANLSLTDFTQPLFGNLIDRVIRQIIPIVIASRIALHELKKIATSVDAELAGRLEVALPHNVTTEMGLSLAHVAGLLPPDLDAKKMQHGLANNTLPSAFREAWQVFMNKYGHRAPMEIDIASPRYRDNPQMLIDLMLSLRNADGENPQEKFDRNQRQRHEAFEIISERIHEQGWLATKRLQWLYRVVENLAGYRETPKFYLIFSLDLMRRKILKLAEQLVERKRLESIEQVFDITLDDLQRAINNPLLDLITIARENRSFKDRLARLKLPTVIDSRGLILRPPVPPIIEGMVVGTPISAGTYNGPIKVLNSPDEKPFNKGEILVARATDPGWTPLFVNAGAVILEVGGLLQHGALVAREYGLPCVGGVAGATTLWPDGTMVEVDGAAGTIRTL